MEKFISKITNRRLKGNVSLLVIFILLASSVIALLSINQIQHLLTYGNMTFNYFRAFYLAKAWTELGLTEVYYREAWFEQNIGSWDAVVVENLVWEAYSGFNPYFTMDIQWRFKFLTDDIRHTDKCDDDNKIVLWTWEWIMLSLFTDITEWFDKIFNEESTIKPIDPDDIKKLEMDVKWNWLTFWLFAYNPDEYGDYSMAKIIVKKWSDLTDLNYFLSTNIWQVQWERRYLTIKNSSDKPISFCINRNDNELIPYSDSLITVRGNYWNMEVWLQSIVKKTTPAWSLNVFGDPENTL